MIEAELPLDGSRIEGAVPPVVAGPSWAIRKRATRVFPLAHYVEVGSMTEAQAEALRGRSGIGGTSLVSGGTGSGKTTLVTAILDETVRLGEASERFVLLEDTVELQCSAANHVALRTSPQVDLAALVRATLRLNPDRIVIGEVRGREALDLLKAWNTGHPGGCTTVHANHAAAALGEDHVLFPPPQSPRRRLLADDAAAGGRVLSRSRRLVLPHRFVRLRAFGWLANRHRREGLEGTRSPFGAIAGEAPAPFAALRRRK